MRSPARRIAVALFAMMLALGLRPSVGGCVTGAAACMPKSCCGTEPAAEAQLHQRMPCCRTAPCTDPKTTTVERRAAPQLTLPASTTEVVVAAAPRGVRGYVHVVLTPPVPIYLRLRSLLL